MVTSRRIGSRMSIWIGRYTVRWIMPCRDQSDRSCSAYTSAFCTGSALRSFCAFHCRSTGAYVSGRKAKARRVQNPAKIIMIQKTHRQPRLLMVRLLHVKTLERFDRAIGVQHSQSSGNRAKDGTNEHTSREDRRSRSARDRVPDVNNDTSADCQGSTSQYTSEEAGD